MILRASGIKSKHIIAVIKPAANSNIKLSIFFEFTFIKAPKKPPKVVPIMPKIKPYKLIIPIFSIYRLSFDNKLYGNYEKICIKNSL